MSRILALNDTIAALCTAPGGALAVIRISGPESLPVLSRIWKGKAPLADLPPRTLAFGHILNEDGSTGETCLAVRMPAPFSYTGEDVAELQCHGGSASSARLLQRILKCGARAADPGEFTRRAFLNGKMDLTQAEAVLELVSARSEGAVRLAERQLSGVLGNAVRKAEESLYHLLAEMESHLDFPDEELDWIPDGDLIRQMETIRKDLQKLLSGRDASALLRDGVRLVIAGNPNSGKSSLLNRLLGYDRALVSDIPGTTRDTLHEHALIRGIPVEISDTAGIRKAPSDIVEKMGIDRSRETIRTAAVILWLFDASESPLPDPDAMMRECPARIPKIAVWNKIDLVPGFVPPAIPGCVSAAVSALDGTGIDSLLDQFASLAGSRPGEEPECAVSTRHCSLLEKALDSVSGAMQEIPGKNYELAAAALRSALNDLRTITGESTDPDILDDIFSRFCIGK